MIYPLLSTEEAITFLAGGRAPAGVRRVLRRRLYGWAKDGLIVNHGGSQRGRALWDSGELDCVRQARNALPYDQTQAVTP